VTYLHQLTSCPTAWRWYRDHRLYCHVTLPYPLKRKRRDAEVTRIWNRHDNVRFGAFGRTLEFKIHVIAASSKS